MTPLPLSALFNGHIKEPASFQHILPTKAEKPLFAVGSAIRPSRSTSYSRAEKLRYRSAFGDVRSSATSPSWGWDHYVYESTTAPLRKLLVAMYSNLRDAHQWTKEDSLETLLLSPDFTADLAIAFANQLQNSVDLSQLVRPGWENQLLWKLAVCPCILT